MNANAIRLRSSTLDSLRGLTLFSMIAYHLCWDLVYLRGLPWAWYNGFWAYIWQQSICCTFILLSGYCWRFWSPMDENRSFPPPHRNSASCAIGRM